MTAARAVDRVLRAGHYWVPQWYKGAHNLAFWNKFSWPEMKPKYERGALETWWYDAEKAAKLNPDDGDSIRPMAAYLLKRLLLIIPTLFGIMLISFVIVQFAPGGPVEQLIAQLTGRDSSIVSAHRRRRQRHARAAQPVAARPGRGRQRRRRSIAARRASIRNSSRASRSSSASTSRRTSASS